MLEQDLEFIYQSLMPRTKIQISYLGEMLGCKLKSNLRKSEMATGLADYIINCSDEWLRCLPQRELDLLEIMVKMEKGSEYRTFLQPYATVMEAFGFITEERDDDSSTFSIVPELYDSIKEHLPMALSFRAANSYMDFEALLMGILNTYGLVEHKEMLEIFSSIYDFDTDPQLAVQSMQFLYESFLMRMQTLRKDGVIYYRTMIRNGNLEEVIPERKSRKEIKDYRPFTKEEFMAAGFNPLYPFVGKDSPSGKKLTAFMEKIGLGEEERNVIGTLVWLNAQEGGTKGPMNAMHLFDGLLKGFDQLQEMMGIVQEYMNNVPKWIFKGYSSHEVFEKFEKPHLQPLLDKMPPMGFGMGVPRVGRNEPCPCGSGLKYKNCHGKYNS